MITDEFVNDNNLKMIELKPMFHAVDFKDLDKKFKSMLTEFSPIGKSVTIKEYFGEGIGIATALKYFANNGILEEGKDFQGIYVFSKEKTPFYVGISQHVIERITQHVKGKNHFSSSFCYRLGANVFKQKHGYSHEGGRKGLPFGEYVEPTKKQLIDCQVAFYKVEDSLELYLFEVYVAMKFGTLYYNSFKTS